MSDPRNVFWDAVQAVVGENRLIAAFIKAVTPEAEIRRAVPK